MYSEADYRRAEQLIEFLSAEYIAEVPLRIHARGTDAGHGLGGPPFAHEFILWLDAGSNEERLKEKRARQRGEHVTPDHRQRVTRVFRKIRAVAPREYYVLMLVCSKGMNIPEVVTAMNTRAESGGHPERYDERGVTALLMSALDKTSSWY